MIQRALIAALTTLLLFYTNCAGVEEPYAPLFPLHVNSGYYFQTAQTVDFEVYYEPGAEPFTGNSSGGRPYWGILKDNIDAIFQYRTARPTVNIPTALSQMSQIETQNQSAWTTDEILALAERYRSQLPTDTGARFYIYFVRGYYDDGSGPNPNVIGVNITSAPIIVMFKQVIQNSGFSPTGPVPKFVEQSTLVHELGHALGFVNTGITPSTPHEDTVHRGHTVNQDCVMYWLNEGASDLGAFVQRYLTSTSFVMWGPEVLADAKSVSR